MAADVDIFPTEGNVRGPLIGSVTLHVALFGLALFGYLIPSSRGESWGGTGGNGGAMSATLVSSIPLPVPPTETKNVLANESKGLTQSPPKEIPKEEPKAIPIPARDAKKKGPQGVHAEEAAAKRNCEGGGQQDSVWPGRAGQRPLRFIYRGRSERRAQLYRRHRRFWQPLRLVCGRSAPQGVGKLAEV